MSFFCCPGTMNADELVAMKTGWFQRPGGHRSAVMCVFVRDNMISKPFLSTVATCMLSMRDCCKVNASDCPLLLHAHPRGVDAASHRLDAICWVPLDRKLFNQLE
ncbi:hypothetical protein ATANTOWER_002450 [Ataeniobius toweri]|uniref:Uncharacterized protein n=1 Tax=Ataeniobius toweri TaxID=208326 RepID=A0ABU7A4B3_9TELE|nr:hypothetical protein [Ataeniobius toweri]